MASMSKDVLDTVAVAAVHAVLATAVALLLKTRLLGTGEAVRAAVHADVLHFGGLAAGLESEAALIYRVTCQLCL